MDDNFVVDESHFYAIFHYTINKNMAIVAFALNTKNIITKTIKE